MKQVQLKTSNAYILNIITNHHVVKKCILKMQFERKWLSEHIWGEIIESKVLFKYDWTIK